MDRNNRHSYMDRIKSRRPQPYAKNYRQIGMLRTHPEKSISIVI